MNSLQRTLGTESTVESTIKRAEVRSLKTYVKNIPRLTEVFRRLWLPVVFLGVVFSLVGGKELDTPKIFHVCLFVCCPEPHLLEPSLHHSILKKK
jgi:hypothetical protein